MRHYTHLSIEDRENIRVFLETGLSISETARRLGRSKSTINRELKRNSNTKGEYHAHNAQKKYQKRKQTCGAKRKLEDEETRKHVIENLRAKQPYCLAGRQNIRRPCRRPRSCQVREETSFHLDKHDISCYRQRTSSQESAEETTHQTEEQTLQESHRQSR